MKSISLKNNFKKYARVALILLLAFSIVIGPASYLQVYADEQEGITWTRLKSDEDMYNTFRDANHTKMSDKAGYKPILILFKSGSTWYYAASGCYYNNDGDGQINATKVKATSGINPGADSFKCRTDCNSLFCKYTRDYDGYHEYVLAYRNYTEASNQIIGMNMKWYGVQYACCCEGSIWITDRNDPGKYYNDSGSCCSATCFPEWRIYGYSKQQTFEIKWHTTDRTTNDRHWCIGGAGVWISRDGDNACKDFMIYVGEVTANAVQTTSSVVQPYTATKLANYTIKSGVEIVVEQGACYVLDGENFNCGHIVVDGGTLVVRGLLDADEGGLPSTGKYGSYNTSDIHILNGGQLIVERSGVVVFRNNQSSIYLDKNSSAYIEGTIVCAQNLSLGENCSLRAMPGSFVGIGIQPQSTIPAREYTPDTIVANAGAYLSNIAKYTKDSTGNEITDAMYDSMGMRACQGSLTIGNNASFISYGAVFIPSTSQITYGSNAFSDAWYSTNINASLASMMRQW